MPGLPDLATILPILANAGTPLLWATILHLFVGNALIGLAEGLLLARSFNVSKKRAVATLILANYASAWIGGILILTPLTDPFDVTVQHVRLFVCGVIAAAVVITLVIELPFVWAALRASARPWHNTMRGVLLVHALSYPVIFGWYALVSGTSMMTRLKVVPAQVLVADDIYDLYFITPSGDQVIQSDLTGQTQKVVSNVSAHHDNDRLFARRTGDKAFDLWLLSDSNKGKADTQRIAHDFSTLAPIDWAIAEGDFDEPSSTWFNAGPASSITAQESRYRTHFWPYIGISYQDRGQSSRYYAFATPFLRWNARNATEISGGRVVFQLGRDQICLLDAKSNQIALLARGKGPLVASSAKPPPRPAEQHP